MMTRRQDEETQAGRDRIGSLLSAIVDSSDDAIVSKSLDGIVTSWNVAAEKMFGYTASEMIGQSIRRIIPTDRQAEEDFVLDRIRRGEKVDHFETVRQTKDGRLVDISLTVSPIKEVGGIVVGASKTARDITARKRLEREREEALNKLAEALAARDEFIAIAAHELRNPLNILTLLWRILDRAPSQIETSRVNLIQKSRAQLARLSSLVDRLLDVTRIRSGTFDLYLEEFELSALIREVASRFSLGDSGHKLSLELEREVTGTWDRLRIDQVITNLISNAVKFGNEKQIAVKSRLDGEQVVVAVHDEGVGISPENIGRIFERFERGEARRYQEGLGLGLWITREIVQAHGGSVLAESELGKGSTFTVRLPLRRQE